MFVMDSYRNRIEQKHSIYCISFNIKRNNKNTISTTFSHFRKPLFAIYFIRIQSPLQRILCILFGEINVEQISGVVVQSESAEIANFLRSKNRQSITPNTLWSCLPGWIYQQSCPLSELGVIRHGDGVSETGGYKYLAYME